MNADNINKFQSDDISELAKALVNAQLEITNAKMDSKNPHFKSDYASLESVIEAVRKTLNKNNIIVNQLTNQATVITQLTHISGQWIRSITPVINEKNTCQSFGSGLSYARRYGLSAIICIGQEDDDGNEATELAQKPASKMQSAADFVMPFGKQKGQTLGEIGAMQVSQALKWVKQEAKPEFRDSKSAKEFIFWADAYLKKNPISELDSALNEDFD